MSLLAATYEAPWEGDLARIDWKQPSGQVHNLIRGSDRQPGAWITFGGATVKRYGSRVVDGSGASGTVAAVAAERAADAGLTICCEVGAVRVDPVMPEGATRGPAHECTAANGVVVGDVFE